MEGAAVADEGLKKAAAKIRTETVRWRGLMVPLE
jgi:hypothetical protein